MAKKRKKKPAPVDYERLWEKSLRPPRKIAIHRDELHAKYVGRTETGEQFFLTAPYVAPDAVAAQGYPRRDFVALYLFDKKGVFLRAEITDLGTREKKDTRALRDAKKRAEAERDRLLATLGEVTYGNIKVAPFAVTKFKIEFGLSHSGPEDPFEPWLAAFGPGFYMRFTQPWDSGTYEPVFNAEPLF